MPRFGLVVGLAACAGLLTGCGASAGSDARQPNQWTAAAPCDWATEAVLVQAISDGVEYFTAGNSFDEPNCVGNYASIRSQHSDEAPQPATFVLAFEDGAWTYFTHGSAPECPAGAEGADDLLGCVSTTSPDFS